MQGCKFTITTAVDGEENTVVKKGNIDFLENSVVLQYAEESANVCITLQKGEATVVRQGDYSLSLALKQGKQTEGNIGLDGADGRIAIQTHNVKYAKERNVFKLSLRYDLIFSQEEKQKMQLKLRASLKE